MLLYAICARTARADSNMKVIMRCLSLSSLIFWVSSLTGAVIGSVAFSRSFSSISFVRRLIEYSHAVDHPVSSKLTIRYQ